MKKLIRMSTWPRLTARSSRQHQSTICLGAAALAVVGGLCWPAVPRAEEAAEPPAEAAPATDPRQLCLGAATSPDERLKACSAVIESGPAQGSILAAAYTQRGFIFTLIAISSRRKRISIKPSRSPRITRRPISIAPISGP